MDPLLGPARPEAVPGSASSDRATDAAATAAEPADGSAQTMLDAWLQQLQADQTEEPVVESRLDFDSLFGSELEFDLDFLTELSSLKGAGGGDGGVSLHELSQDLELGLLCPPGTPLEPEPIDIGTLSGQELFSQDDPPPAPTPTPAAGTAEGPLVGEPPASTPPRPPPVASISVVTNKQRGKTVVTISTPRGRQSFVLPTADLTQASRVLRALQQKRRRSRACAAAAAAAAASTEEEDSTPAEAASLDVGSPAAAGTGRPNTATGRRMSSQVAAKDDDDPVMSEALKHLGVDMRVLEVRKNGKAVELACPEPGCDVSLQNVFKLKVHILRHRNYRPYKCSAEGCKWEFFERGKLNRHEATHAKAPLKCGEPGCPAAFRTKTNLQRHRALIHGLSAPAPVARETVAASASASVEISAPGRVPLLSDSGPETGEDGADHDPLVQQEFMCSICDRTFKRATGLKRHLNWHEAQAASACSFPGCDFTAPSLQQLKLHEKRHGEKQYKCTFPECSWSFHSHAKLKRHLSQHTGRRNYRCPYAGCEKSYRRMEYLSGHIRLHLGRYYQCPQKGCRLRFTHQFSLATHIRSVHEVPSAAEPTAAAAPASVTCPMCDARFKSEIYRQIHLQDVHGTSSSKLLEPESSARADEECSARKKKSKFNPESLNWVEDGDPVVADDGETYTVYVPFEVETDSGPSEVLVKCDVTEDECRRLGIELGPEACDGDSEQPPVSYDHVLAETNTSKDTARQLRRMGVGVLSAGLRRTAHSGCARTDITSCHLAVRRSRPRPRRPPAGRQRRPGGSPRKHAERSGGGPPLYDPALVPESVCRTALEPPSLLCDSDLLGSVHDQLQHSTINLSDLT